MKHELLGSQPAGNSSHPLVRIRCGSSLYKR